MTVPAAVLLRRPRLRVFVLLLSMAAMAPAAAQPAGVAAPASGRQQVAIPSGDEEADVKIELPGYPADADLVELRQRLRPDLRFYVDSRSVQVLPGGEIHYTFVIRTSSGARNVTHEVMRCMRQDRMILAVGTADRKWMPSRFLRWEPIEQNDMAGQRAALHKDIFCPARVPVADAREAVAALKAGMHPRAVPE
jgi:hypothetical protein